MRFLFITFLSITLLISIKAQINGTWLQDWQTAYLAKNPEYPLPCGSPPSSMTIILVTSTYANLNYNYEGESDVNCNLYSGPYSLQLTSTNQWSEQDSINTQFIYDPTTDTITWNNICLFSRNGSFMQEQTTLGPYFGQWVNPSIANPSSITEACCAPGSFYLSPQGFPGTPDASLNIHFDREFINCPNPSNVEFLLNQTSTTSLTWIGQPQQTINLNYPMMFTFGSSLNELIVSYSFNGSCQYVYTKAVPTPILNGTWLKDWQTSKDIEQYQVTAFNVSNNIYMLSTLTINSYQEVNSFISLSSDGDLTDAYNFENSDTPLSFSYNSTTQTLLADAILLSLNGSVLSSAPFIGTWNTSQVVNASSIPTDYCVPSSIVISQNTTSSISLSIVYNFSPESVASYGCQGFSQDINDDNQITSYLEIFNPSPIQLYWEEPIMENVITFVNPSNYSQINVSNIFGDANGVLNYAFIMTSEQFETVSDSESQNPVTPSPLSSSLASIGTILISFIILSCY